MRIQIFVPISRENRISEVVEDINKLDTTGNEIEVLFMIDNKNVSRMETKYRTKIVYTGNFAESVFDVHRRRKRIADAFNRAKCYIKDVDLVFTFEDDCEIKNDVLKILINDYLMYSAGYNIGFMSGVQAGRWSHKMLGVWKMEGDTIRSMKLEMGIVPVTACGFYSFVTKPEVFRMNEFRRSFFGPDVNFGIDTTNIGYSNFCDMELKIGHKTNDGSIIYPNGSEKVLEFNLNNL